MFSKSENALANSIGVPYVIRQIRIHSYTINYLVAGDGAPLVLIHGANFGWGMWYKNIAELSKNFTVYAIDLPGAGGSTRIHYKKLDFSSDFVVVVAEFIERHKLYGASIIGHSIGAWVAVKVAMCKHLHVKKIMLIDPVGFHTELNAFDRCIQHYRIAQLLSRTLLYPHRRNSIPYKFLSAAVTNSKTLSQEFVDHYYQIIKTSPYICLISKIIRSRQLLMFKSGDLKLIRKIGTVIFGEQDPIIPLSQIEAQIRSARIPLWVFPHVGHVPQMENSVLFNEQVINLL